MTAPDRLSLPVDSVIGRWTGWFTAADVQHALPADVLAALDQVQDRSETSRAVRRVLGRLVVDRVLILDRPAQRYKATAHATAREIHRCDPRPSRAQAERAWAELQRAGGVR